MFILDFLFKKNRHQREKFKEEYRAMSSRERDDHFHLLEHYSVYGGPFSQSEIMEMCEVAMEVDNEELDGAQVPDELL